MVVTAGFATVVGTHHHDFLQMVCSGGVVALKSMEKTRGHQGNDQQ
jgi:hypothetical protein